MDIVDDDVDMDAMRDEDEAAGAPVVEQDDENEPLENPDGPPNKPAPISTPLLKTEEQLLATRIKSCSDMRVGVASDYMRVKVGEFAELEKFVPAMQALLAEEEEKLEAEENDDDVAAAAHGIAAGGGKKDKGEKGEKGEKKQKQKQEKKEKIKAEKKERWEKEKKEGEQKHKGEQKQKGEKQQKQK
ncbi:hypothetical protein SLS56_011118 [Neofusicoccum ribis]|uniref:Uncharacterized protein n=1 Tax=Neofusicoccum ribis TaxID=45134 RepID=A0ABR3SDZ6_9PEZI